MRPPHLDDGDVRLYLGDCIEVMREMDAESVDAVVCDPPYGLEFMGKEWDKFAPGTMRKRSGWDDAQSGASITVSGFDPLGKNGTPAYGGSRSSYECARCGRRDAFRKVSGCGTHEEHDWRAINPNGTAPLVAFAAWCETWAREALRVLKPGGHLLAFGGTRTFHRLACGIEDAGFEVRDCLSWLYGSGFPKSLDVSKAIDKKRDDRAAIYEVTKWIREARDAAGIGNKDIDAAFGFAGMAGHWTSAKSQPSVPTIEQVEPLLSVLGVALDDVPPRIAHLLWELNGRKGQPGEAWKARRITGKHADAAPAQMWKANYGLAHDLTAKERRDIPATDAAREWQGWGTALKPAWEPCVVARKPLAGTVAENVQAHGTGALNIDGCRIEHQGADGVWGTSNETTTPGFNASPGQAAYRSEKHADGRWPANVAFDEEAAAMLDAQTGERPSGARRAGEYGGIGAGPLYGEGGITALREIEANTGGASRFFYTAKASRADRTTGGVANNTHPTVKPTDLMRWLVRLVTPTGGVVLDPFAGSGSTLVAARAEGVRAIGIEREEEYAQIIADRLSQLSLFSEAS